MNNQLQTKEEPKQPKEPDQPDYEDKPLPETKANKVPLSC